MIARYLYYFVLITKHGTYIDGFAGPQRSEKPDMWAAKLVLESEPRWLRNIFLCDNDPVQVERLRNLVAVQPQDEKRKIVVLDGDFNDRVHDVLGSGSITGKEATFCLLDQRTFECNWATLEALAAHKEDRKIELFYFLPVGWLARSMSGIKDEEKLRAWWGGENVDVLKKADSWEQGILMARRIEKKLEYAYVHPWPICKERHKGRLMYFMIHASDHPEAPRLMRRAYANALKPPEPLVELQQALDLDTEG